jgi:putative heme-binding domain-containing protein
MDPALRRLASDPVAGIALRVQALRALTRPQSPLAPDAFAMLLGELVPTHAATRRLTAVEILASARLTSEQFVRFIPALAGDVLVSPAVAVGSLPAGKLGIAESDTLLNYLRESSRSGWTLNEAQLAAVGQAVAGERTGEWQSALAELRRTVELQRQQLVTLEPLLRAGDAERGRTLFTTKAACAVCHRVAGEGGISGPDLTKIGAIRSGRDLIESLVMPSATLAQGYETYTATLDNGDTITGIRVRQADDSLVLRDLTGAETRLPAGPGVKLEQQKLSLMPEGLLATLSEAEIRDLLAYLQSLK